MRIVVLGGAASFSAGADLNWMKRAAGFTHEQNVEDARKFAGMLRALAGMSKPTIARVQGAALGGGTGLTAACDMAVASSDALFSTSEVKFGIIPSAISPMCCAHRPAPRLRYYRAPNGSAPARIGNAGRRNRRTGCLMPASASSPTLCCKAAAGQKAPKT